MTETRVSMQEESGDGRVIRGTKQMKGGESESSGFSWIISIIFFVHFLLVNTFLYSVDLLTSVFRL